MNTLSTKYRQFKEANPKVRIRDAATQLGVSEAELVALGDANIRLRPDFKAILNEIPSLGYVMALTRNDEAVHERKGVYTEASFSGKIGQVVNKDIDLRLFLFGWYTVFAVQEGERKSIQFFAIDGKALHKIFLTDKSNVEAYQRIVEKFKMDAPQQEAILKEQHSPTDRNSDDSPADDLDVAAFQRDWLALENTHNFFAILKKHGLSRTQALEMAPEGYAKAIAIEDLKTILRHISESELEIMIFIGNKGCIQIHSGKVKKLVQVDNWFNVLDGEFNMHLQQDRIGSTWIVRKPTVDGIVSSIEVFNLDKELVVQFFGIRKSGILESEDWRKALSLVE